MKSISIYISFLSLIFSCLVLKGQERPNILLIMSDNQSWNHLGAYGDSVIKTPNIDQVAQKGIIYSNVFCGSPSCTPSRAGLLTGQDIYRLKEGANLWGILPKEFDSYVDLLEKSGYQVGYEGKGWGPGNIEASGRSRNPGGDLYADFETFLKKNEDNGQSPWHYWFSSKHPHRPFKTGSGKESGMAIDKIKVPPYLPDSKEVREDIADYYYAIQEFDQEVGQLLATLKNNGQEKNTLIIICSDNGWQMPRGLANVYDAGARVPLIFNWSGNITAGKAEQLINLNQLAPTILKAAGLPIPTDMTAQAIDFIDKAENTEDFIIMARERHALVRKNGLGYPVRAIRTAEYLYILNLESERWPAGEPPLFGDVDAHMLHYPSASKIFILANKKNPKYKRFFDYAFEKRPEEELYKLATDPDQIINLANKKEYHHEKEKLKQRLIAYLKSTGDPRFTGGSIIWDESTYYQKRDFNPKPSEEARKALNLEKEYHYFENK